MAKENLERIVGTLSGMLEAGESFVEMSRYLRLKGFTPERLADSLGDSYGIGKTVVDSFAFNFGDELTALVDSGLTGKDYEESYQQKKMLRQLYEAQNPNSARAGSFAGALASGLPVGLKLEGYLGRAGMDEGFKRIATASAIEGGISGAGAGEGWERLFSTIGAGALSGVFGASTYGLISVLGKIRRTVGNLTGLGAAQTADDKILQAYDMSGINPDDAAKEMRTAAAQDPDLALTPMDLDPNIAALGDAATQRPGVARSLSEGTPRDPSEFKERNRDQYEGIMQDLRSGTTSLNTGDIDYIIQQLQDSAKPLYDQAYRRGRVDSPLLSQLQQKPTIQAAYQEGANLARKRREAFGDVPEFPDEPPDGPWETVMWDYTKRGLDALRERIPKDASGSRQNYASLDKLKDDLRTEVSRLNPDYGDALKQFAGAGEIKDAFEAGTMFRSTSPDQVASIWRKMGDSEREAYRVSAVQSLESALGQVRRGRDLTLSIHDVPNLEQKLQLIFSSPEEYANFSRRLALRAQMQQTNNLMRNSATARRQATEEMVNQDSQMASDVLEMAGSLATGGKSGLLGAAWNAGKSRISGYTPTVYDKMAPYFFRDLPSAADELERMATSAAKRRQNWSDAKNATGRLLSYPASTEIGSLWD